MELKLFLAVAGIAGTGLLIVPYGIETIQKPTCIDKNGCF